MESSYCGKQCADCPEYQTACPGCRDTQAASSDCAAARCCRSSRRESCQSCPAADRCTALASARQTRRTEAFGASENPMVYDRSLLKLFRILLVISIVQCISEAVTALISLPLSLVVSVVCLVAYPVVFWKLGVWDERYQKAAFCSVVTQVLPIISALITRSALVSVVVLLVGIYGEYNKLMAHSAVTGTMDETLARKWQFLWELHLLWFCIVGGGILAMLLIPSLSILLDLASSVFQLVLTVLNLIYLWQTVHIPSPSGN